MQINKFMVIYKFSLTKIVFINCFIIIKTENFKDVNMVRKYRI